jgi:hypothetical protein
LVEKKFHCRGHTRQRSSPARAVGTLSNAKAVISEARAKSVIEAVNRLETIDNVKTIVDLLTT